MNKLKPKYIAIIAVIAAVIIGVSPFLFINITLIGSDKLLLDYGETYSEPGFRASAFNKDVTQSVDVSTNLKEDVGEYQIEYSYSFLFYTIKRTRAVSVADLTGPEITLNGDKDLSITINTSYEEPGYTAIDKLDGDLTDDVIVTNNIDITKLGDYEVVYEAKDKAGNISTAVRKVKVERLNPAQMSIAEYTLDGWFDSVKLSETEDQGDEYFNKITLVGDSNVKNMYLKGYLKGMNAWAIPCLHAESMHSIDLYIYGSGKMMTLLKATELYKPEIMLLNFGTFSTNWISEETFITKANEIIDKIEEISPDTKIILASIYPIKKGEKYNGFKQEVINKYNFLILKMADEHVLKYLDIQEALKGEDGYGIKEYYHDDYFHLTPLGYEAVKNYIRTHALMEE